MAEDMNLQINVTGSNMSMGAFESLNSSIAQVQSALRSLGEASANAARSTEENMQAASSATETLARGATDAGQAMRDMGAMMAAQMIGEQLKQIGEAGMNAFEEAIGAAADFEFNVSRIGAVLTTVGKASNGQMQQMAQDALNLGSNSSFSANEIAEGMYTLARQGLDASTILGNGVNGAINIVNDLAQATDSNMTDTATVITDVVHEYGLSGNSLREVANIMSGALHNSSESLDDFYQSMKQVGPVAAAMHQNVNDMSTALALLAQHGITGSSAGTALKNMLLGLSPHTQKAASMMKDLGISTKNGAVDSFYQLNGNLKPLPEIIDILNQKFGGLNDSQKQAALATTFTKYGLAGLNVVVTQSRDKFLEFQNELKKDDAATIAAKKMDNLHGDFLKFQAGVQTMMKSFGDALSGPLRQITQAATEAIKWMAGLPKPVKEVAMVVLGLGSALLIAAGTIIAIGTALAFMAPGLALLGSVIGGVTAAIGSFLAPVALVVAAVAAVGIGFKLAYDHIKPFRDAVNLIGKDIGKAISSIKAFAQGVTMILTGTGGGKGIDILQKLGFSQKTIQDLMKMGGQFRVAFNAIKTVIVTVMNTIGNTVKQALGIIFNGWSLNGKQLLQTITQVWNAIKSFVGAAVSFLVSTIGTAVTSIYNWWTQYWPEIQQIFSVVWTVMKALLLPILATISLAITAAIGFIKGAWQNGWQAILAILKSVWDSIKGVIKVAFDIISGLVSFWIDLLTGHFRKAGSDLINIFRNIFNDIKSTFNNLASDAFNFGKNFVLMLGKGITGAVGNVVNAAKGVADKIKSFLGFHSPTEDGPASDSDRWGPNFVNMVAQGIQDYTPKIQAAVNGIALTMQTGMTTPITNNISNAPILSSAGSRGNVYITVQANRNITKNEQQLGDIVSRAILDKMKMQGKLNL